MSALIAKWKAPKPGSSSFGWIDPQIAAGHEFVIVTMNWWITYYDKTGKLLAPKGPAVPTKPPQNPIKVAAFFSPLNDSLKANLNLPAGVDPVRFGIDSFYDTRVIFDPYRNRFWIGCLAINSQTKAKAPPTPLTAKERGSRRTKFCLAVSKTEDPRDGWHRYWWDAIADDGKCNVGEVCNGMFSPGDAGDYEFLGISKHTFTQSILVAHRDPNTGAKTDRVYHVVNIANADTLAAGGGGGPRLDDQSPFLSTVARVPKPDETPYQYRSNGRYGTVQPTLQLTDDSDSVYFVGLFQDGKKHSVLVWERTLLASDQLFATAVPVKPWTEPGSPPPQGASAAIPSPNPLLFRPFNVFCSTYVNGFIHLAFGDTATKGGSSVAGMRVVRIPVKEKNAADWSNPAKGFIDQLLPGNVSDTHYGWPALTATAKGDMVLSYIRTSATSFPEVRYNIWPVGASGVQPSVGIQQGEMPFVQSGAAPGDTVADIDMVNIAPDPDGKSAWIAHPYPYTPAAGETPPINLRLAIGRVLVT